MSENTSSNKRIAKNSIFLSIRMVVVLAITLYTTRVLLRILGVVDYGTYNVVCGFVAMFTFLNRAMSNGIQRFFNYELGKSGEEGANRVYCTAVFIQFILAVIIIVLTESFGLWYLHNKMVIPDDRMIAAEWIFQFSILSFLFVIMQAPYSAAVMAHERMDFYAIINVLDAFIKLGIVFLLPYLRADQLIMYGLLRAGVSVVNFFIYYFYCKRNFKEIKLHRYFDKKQFLSMLSFSGWNLFGSLSNVLKEQGINLVINFFFGPIVNAARGIAAQVNGGLHGFVANITMPVRPQVVQSYAKGNIDRTMNLTYGISKLSCCFLLMMAIPISFEIDYILRLWLGDNIPQHANTFVIIVLFTSLISNLSSATSGVVHATGIMRDYQLWGSLISMSSVPLAYFLLKSYAIPEIALLAVFVCSALGHFVCLFVVRKLVGMSVWDYFKRIVIPIIEVMAITIVLVFPVHMFMREGFLRLVVVSLLSVVLVGLLFYYIGFNKSERKMSLQFVSSFFKRLRRSKI